MRAQIGLRIQLVVRMVQMRCEVTCKVLYSKGGLMQLAQCPTRWYYWLNWKFWPSTGPGCMQNAIVRKWSTWPLQCSSCIPATLESKLPTLQMGQGAGIIVCREATGKGNTKGWSYWFGTSTKPYMGLGGRMIWLIWNSERTLHGHRSLLRAPSSGVYGKGLVGKQNLITANLTLVFILW